MMGQWLMTVLLLGTVSGIGGIYRDHGATGKWDPLVLEGLAQVEAGDWPVARRFLRRALDKGCRDGLVYITLGMGVAKANDWEKAEKLFRAGEGDFKQRYSSYTVYDDYLETRSQTLLQLRNPQAAKPFLEELLLRQPDSLTGLVLLGTARLQLGETEEAVTLLTRAFPQLPESSKEQVGIMLVRGNVDLNRDQQAVAWIDQVLARNASHPDLVQLRERLTGEQRSNRSVDPLLRMIQRPR